MAIVEVESLAPPTSSSSPAHRCAFCNRGFSTSSNLYHHIRVGTHYSTTVVPSSFPIFKRGNGVILLDQVILFPSFKMYHIM